MRNIAFAFLVWASVGFADSHAFLASIASEPADDTTRLVFADWLDEHGQHDRAKFIRMQIEYIRMPWGEPGSEALRRKLAMAEEVDAFRLQHQDAWLPPKFLEVMSKDPQFGLWWERGFPCELRMSAESLARKEVRDALNGLEAISSIDFKLPDREPARAAALRNIRELELTRRARAILFNYEEWSARSMTDSEFISMLPVLSKAKAIFLGPNAITRKSLEALRDSPAASGLKVLCLGPHSSAMSSETLGVIVSSGNFTSLEQLDLTGVPLENLSPFITRNRLPALTSLLISTPGGSLTPAKVNAFVRSPAFSRLNEFAIDDTHRSGVPLPQTSFNYSSVEGELSTMGIPPNLTSFYLGTSHKLSNATQAKLEANAASRCHGMIVHISEF